MARVTLDAGTLSVRLLLPEAIFSFHGEFNIPLSHVTGAYASTLQDLQLRMAAARHGSRNADDGRHLHSAGRTTFCDVHGRSDRLVIETRDQRFRRLAFTLDDGEEPGEAARLILTKIVL